MFFHLDDLGHVASVRGKINCQVTISLMVEVGGRISTSDITIRAMQFSPLVSLQGCQY
jgi:hypothetical protein